MVKLVLLSASQDEIKIGYREEVIYDKSTRNGKYHGNEEKCHASWLYATGNLFTC